MITHQEFVAAAKELEQLGLGWSWIDHSTPPNGSSLEIEGYLERTLIAPIASGSVSDVQAPRDSAAAASATAPADATSPALALASWTLHACYSHTYTEPVLYFQAAELSGTPLTPTAVLAHLRAELDAAGHAEVTPDGLGVQMSQRNSNSIPAVTQELHPLLRHPYYCIHPCGTSEVMAVLGGEEGMLSPLRYLLAWLRVAAGPLGAAPTPEEWRDALNEH